MVSRIPKLVPQVKRSDRPPQKANHIPVYDTRGIFVGYVPSRATREQVAALGVRRPKLSRRNNANELRWIGVPDAKALHKREKQRLAKNDDNRERQIARMKLRFTGQFTDKELDDFGLLDHAYAYGKMAR